ncbi:glycosyltransferase family 4 protein [Massilia sp. DWR3-1-1]|uniref:glycosyltransferase family 4 protein n=1 Tax=Massilia sp. DWR3-1-1 TaxID=2804559 RepID=UPI003CEFF83C
MSVLRVGLGTTMIEPLFNGGRQDGIGVYTTALRRHLPDAGCHVTGFSYPRWGADGAAVTVGQALPQSFEAATLRDLLTPAVHRMHMPVDIFHAPDYRLVRMDCPQVASLHDALPISHPEWCNPRLRSLKNWLQRSASRKADHVIALSHFAVDELVSCFGIDPTRISVVPCGIDDDWQTPPDPAAVRATLAANGLRAGYFLFVGTLQPRKNVDRLIDAWESLPAAIRAAHQLVLVGAAGARSEATVRRLAGARERGEHIVWLDALTEHRALRHVYAGAAVFVFPSLYEGFGIPVVEAMGAGVPVVTSNSSSLPEVSAGAALEVDPRDVGAMAAAMRALLDEPALRARCIAAGLERAAVLTWRAAARQTAAVYHQVLSR